MSDIKHKKHGPWQITKRHSVYQDPWLTVCRDDVIRPDGLPGSYSTVCIKPGVCVIPWDGQGVVHLTKEFHYAVGRDTIEGVSGGIEDGETAEIAAHRELQEEIGIVAEAIEFLGVVDPLTSALRSPTSLYVARGISWVDASPEGTEQIERVSFPLDVAVRMVLDGEITHAPTCTALLKIHILFCGN